jgi:hypothetical protein
MDPEDTAMTVWFDHEGVIAPLEAFAILPEWLRAGMDGERLRRSLERQVPAAASGSLRLLSCYPERLRAKGEEWLARYRFEVAQDDQDPRTVVLVGNLYAPTVLAPTTPPAADDISFGEPGWECWLDDLRLQLQVEETDPALPALQDIVDPAAVAGLLQEVVTGAGYADAVVASCQPEVVRYKPGSRCTVVVRVEYEDPDGNRTAPTPVVVKTHQGDKGQTAWEAMKALWDSPLRHRDVVTLAEPLGYEPGRRLLFQGPIPEDCTLKELAREAITDGTPAALDRLREELAKTGRALAALHDTPTRYGGTATLDDELLEIREVVGRLSLSDPRLEGAAAPLLARLEELSAAHPAEAAVPAHHDFRPAQVLLHAGKVGFIDFDGASMAEPALDLGRFRAKLRDIGITVLSASGTPLAGPALTDNLTLLDELCDHFLGSYLQHRPVSAERVLLWETCDLFTAMLHAWTKVRLARIHPRLTVLIHHLSTPDRVSSGSLT